MNAALTKWSSDKLSALGRTSFLIYNLQTQVGRTPAGEIVGYIDPNTIRERYYDLDPSDATPHDVPDAIVPLSYIDSYPATPEGVPFWERLDGEPTEYYDLFKSFREDTYYKALTAHTQADGGSNWYPHSPMSMRNARTLTRVSERTDTERKVLRTLAASYHWYSRAEAYDKFNTEQLKQRKEAEVQYMQNTHQAAAQRIFTRCMQFLEDHADELNPKTALEWLQTAVELERISLGLPKDKPDSEQVAEHYDRRPWVQINQQYNQPNQNGGQSGTQHSANGGPSKSRAWEITEILHEAGVLDKLNNPNEHADATPEGDVIDAEVEEKNADDNSK